MTIVANNSLTVSNVNDGTIVHIAYANSSDGTDGFYVGGGRNLLVGSDPTSGNSPKVLVGVTEVNVDGVKAWESNNTDSIGFGSILDANTTYTYSALIKVDTAGKLGFARYGHFQVYNSNAHNKVDPSHEDVAEKRDYHGITVPANQWTKICYTFTTNDLAGSSFNVYPSHINGHVYIRNLMLEKGNVAHPWSPAPSEAHSTYMGTYTDFTQADSTNPADYNWALFKGPSGTDGKPGKDGVGIKTTVITYAISTSGTTAPTTSWTSSVPSLVKGQYLWTKTVWNYSDTTSETGYTVTYIAKDGNNGNDGIAGKDGTGIKTTTITYAGSTSGTTAPTSGWTTTVPTVAAGSYLWTKTVWAYTDNTSETGYSVAKMGNNGATGPQGPTGPAGNNGNPGKIVSDKEPSTKFVGLTWKYSGITAIDASDGTNIQPNTEYYWNGKNWVLNQINAQNINVDELTSITSKLGDATAGSLTLAKGDTGGVAIKDGVVKTWDISKVTDPNYPDGNSYTSMGAALDSGGITFYSAGYGQKLDQNKVIDDKYKIATLRAVAGNGRRDGGVGLVLDASNPNFPLNIIGNVRIQDTIDLGKVKSAKVSLGWGRSVILTRVGNQVTMFSNETFSGTMNQGLWNQANERIPNGYKPYGQVYIYSVSIVNQSKFMWYRLGPSGGVEIWQNGNITTSDTMITPVQSWITSDGFPS